MYDWNGNGKIDIEDHTLTAYMIDEMEKRQKEYQRKPSGCCGTTVAMFIISLLLPVFLVAVFATH